MKIVITGFMGSGKSTVSALLAKRLGLECIEIDSEIVSRAGGMPIPEIFERGENAFRDLESTVVNQVSAKDSVVISTGGGTPLRSENVAALRAGGGCIVYLTAKFETIQKRIGNTSERPLFRDPIKAKELYRSRQEVYRSSAEFIVNAEESPETVCNQIVSLLERRNQGPTAEQRRYVVIGDPVAHSLSPRMHGAGYEALGISSTHSFEPLRVSAEELPSFISALRAQQYHGAACTMPHKEALIALVDMLDPMAERIGAINTLTVKDGKVTGYNTDWIGVVAPLACCGELHQKKVLILGAGGASRAAICGLLESEAQVTVTNRSEQKAQALAQRFGISVIRWEERLLSQEWDIIVNTTSVGMGSQGDESPLSGYCFQEHQVILETIYHPRETRLLRDAKKAGARIIEGREMLLHQGMAQFEIFTNRPAPHQAMRAALA